ncbi:DUF1269 domain-containing protein [Streptomyces sp. NPDC054796]
MDENMLFLDLTDHGADEAHGTLDALRQAHSDGDIRLHEATLISRAEDGTLDIPETVDHTHATGFAVGGLVGGLVGLLGGPVGAMIGFSAGGLIGGGRDARRATETNAALETLADAVPPGRTVLAAEVSEHSPDAVDRVLGPDVVRYPSATFREHLEAALSGDGHG